jgi:hypothetical protein
MQQLSLGDYRGNRDTLQAALGQEYSPLSGAMATNSAMAQQGMAGVSKRLSMRQGEADLLSRMIAYKDFEGRMLAEAQKAMEAEAEGEAEMAQAGEMLGGREAAMVDWFGNVLQSYQPDSPEYKQAKRAMDMITGRKRGGLAADKGYLDYIEEYGINEPVNQGTLGSLSYVGGNPKDQKPKTRPTRTGVDSEYDDNE